MSSPSPVGSPDRDFDVSVVIPTYNRGQRLRRVLEALGCQSRTTHNNRAFDFEIIVVSDGSTDDTAKVASSVEIDAPVRLIEQENAGPGAARNTGVEAALGHLIVFLDDDVVPGTDCLAAHVSRHDDADNLVVVGPMLTPDDVELSPWVAWEQHQLYKQYEAFAAGGSVYPRQFYTGNASIEREVLLRCGGFDPSFRRAEDVELGYRLALEHQSFVFEPRALATHYAERSLDSWLLVGRDYGRHDVDFAHMSRHSLGMISGMFRQRHVLQRAAVRAFSFSKASQRIATWSMMRLALLVHRLGIDMAGRWLLSGAYGLSYYGGVAEGLGSRRTLQDLLGGHMNDGALRAWFVLEQTLGHVTHSKNLRSLLGDAPGATVQFLEVDFGTDGLRRRLPGWSNWTVRAGLRARLALRRQLRVERRVPDVLFVHSQVPAVLLGSWMRRIPTVVSLDATPLQYDEFGQSYAHGVDRAAAERIKYRANQRCFRRARHLITWSDWAKQGLLTGYGIDADDVTVIPPGVDLDRWKPDCGRARSDGPLRVLFVGGDLGRKGGDLLIEATRRLHMMDDVPAFETHLVTGADVPRHDGVVVHGGLVANSPELIELYHDADIFCLPTLGDCLPMVLAEAGAAGLPLVATDVGAISEVVRDGETGRLVPPGDLDALVDALAGLLLSEEERRRCGLAARRLVETDHDARKNAERLVGVLRGAALRGVAS